MKHRCGWMTTAGFVGRSVAVDITDRRAIIQVLNTATKVHTMLKVQTATLHKKTNPYVRQRQVATHIYFTPQGEGIWEQLQSRRQRPYAEYKRLLPQVLSSVGVVRANDLVIKWSQTAGCKCGCSPAFIVKGWDAALSGNDVYVDVALAA